jgi:hypothetical protein
VFLMLPCAQNASIRKINDLIKRARAAKVHALLISHLKAQMPMFWKEAKQVGNLPLFRSTRPLLWDPGTRPRDETSIAALFVCRRSCLTTWRSSSGRCSGSTAWQ